MIFDNDEDFDFDDEELEKEMEEERKRVRNLPITKKARDLFETIQSLIETIDEEKDQLNYRGLLFEDIAIINAKITKIIPQVLK